jgi:hypothetical protein
MGKTEGRIMEGHGEPLRTSPPSEAGQTNRKTSSLQEKVRIEGILVLGPFPQDLQLAARPCAYQPDQPGIPIRAIVMIKR